MQAPEVGHLTEVIRVLLGVEKVSQCSECGQSPTMMRGGGFGRPGNTWGGGTQDSGAEG